MDAHNAMDKHPHPHDVICGRGKGSYLHIGNSRFHKLVDKSKQKYLCSSKAEKTKLSRSIVAEIQSLDPPGRFIEYDVSSATWVEVDDKRAWEKSCQALRERKPPKSSCKRDKSKKLDTTAKDTCSATSVLFDTSKITTAQTNSLFPSSTERLKHPTLEVAKSMYEPPVQCLTQNIGVGTSVSSNATMTSSAESNVLFNSVQPSLFIRNPNLPPFLESQTVTEMEDPKFSKALLKLRRKHKIKPTAAHNKPVVTSPEVLQTASDNFSSIQQILDQCVAKSILISNSVYTGSANANLPVSSNELVPIISNRDLFWCKK